MKPLWQIADFVRAMRRRMRFGELSRAPLQLLRFELQGKFAECDWMVRAADVWDSSLPRVEQELNISQQTLRDALALRDLIFAELPNLESAQLRGFRPSTARQPPELMITGYLSRESLAALRVSSLVMKAKLSGLHFHLDNGTLQPLESRPLGSEVMDRISLQEATR